MRINRYDQFSDEKFDKIIKYLTQFNPEIKVEEANDVFPDKWVCLSWNSANDTRRLEISFHYDLNEISLYGTYYIFEDDIWSNEPDDQIIFDFADWKSAWTWFHDDKFDLDQADLLNKATYYKDIHLTYPLPKELIKKMNQKIDKLEGGGDKYFD